VRVLRATWSLMQRSEALQGKRAIPAAALIAALYTLASTSLLAMLVVWTEEGVGSGRLHPGWNDRVAARETLAWIHEDRGAARAPSPLAERAPPPCLLLPRPPWGSGSVASGRT
jgi:hypothetical protein